MMGDLLYIGMLAVYIYLEVISLKAISSNQLRLVYLVVYESLLSILRRQN